jgi:hypothetical protein
VIFQPAVLTQAEIRNNYQKIILGRWKQWQDHLMLICMFQVRLKISNSCRCFYRCRKAVPDFRTSVGECIFHTICFWLRQCQIGSRLSCVMVVYITHICEHIIQVIGDQFVFHLYENWKLLHCSFFAVRNS